MGVRILLGDVRDRLAEIEPESVDCVVTSPPYWGLRDYGVEGQLGMERTLGEHIEVMADVFDLVRRAMKPEATLWLNYGDCYATKPNGRSAIDTKAAGDDDRTFRDKPFSTVGPIYDRTHTDGGLRGSNKGNLTAPAGRVTAGGTLKPKDLCGVPWRVAFALQDRGWWLRQDIIWSKPNPMPESIRDRCTKAHEYLFLMAKSERYYFDAEAIREESGWTADDTKMQDGWDTGPGAHGSVHRGGREKGKRVHVPGNKSHKGKTAYEGGDERHRTKAGLVAFAERERARVRGLPPRHTQYLESSDQSGLDNVSRGDGRNKRSVWTVATQPFSEAHFATFPPALIEPCILAGCPEGGTVLDPFFGAGTTGLVADRLQRNAIGIELNQEYADLAMRRIQREAGLFADISIEHCGPPTRAAA
jgi:DNA modification methylase